MRMIKNIVVSGSLAIMAMAQAKPAPKTPAPPASQTASKPMPASQKVTTAAKPAPTKPMPAPAKAAPAAKKPAPMKSAAAMPMGKPAPQSAAAGKSVAPIAKKPATMASKSKRDPFISPVRLQTMGREGQPACTTGAKCLIIQQVVLKGVVKTPGGMIAMVENAAKKQYNLREKDPVYNGFVLKITGDSIVFRETVTDFLGNSSSKEVVKRVTVPAV